MGAHEDDGSDVRLPPPPPPLLLSFPPPPQPAAVIASNTNSPITPTALKLRLTLPPPVSRLRQRCSIGGVSGLGRSDASDMGNPARALAGPTTHRLASYHARRAEVAELADAPDSKSGSLRGVWVRFPPSASLAAAFFLG